MSQGFITDQGNVYNPIEFAREAKDANFSAVAARIYEVNHATPATQTVATLPVAAAGDEVTFIGGANTGGFRVTAPGGKTISFLARTTTTGGYWQTTTPNAMLRVRGLASGDWQVIAATGEFRNQSLERMSSVGLGGILERGGTFGFTPVSGLENFTFGDGYILTDPRPLTLLGADLPVGTIVAARGKFKFEGVASTNVQTDRGFMRTYGDGFALLFENQDPNNTNKGQTSFTVGGVDNVVQMTQEGSGYVLADTSNHLGFGQGLRRYPTPSTITNDRGLYANLGFNLVSPTEWSLVAVITHEEPNNVSHTQFFHLMNNAQGATGDVGPLNGIAIDAERTATSGQSSVKIHIGDGTATSTYQVNENNYARTSRIAVRRLSNGTVEVRVKSFNQDTNVLAQDSGWVTFAGARNPTLMNQLRVLPYIERQSAGTSYWARSHHFEFYTSLISRTDLDTILDSGSNPVPMPGGSRVRFTGDTGVGDDAIYVSGTPGNYTAMDTVAEGAVKEYDVYCTLGGDTAGDATKRDVTVEVYSDGVLKVAQVVSLSKTAAFWGNFGNVDAISPISVVAPPIGAVR